MKTVTGVVIGLFTIVLVSFGLGLRANSGGVARQAVASQAIPVSAAAAQTDQGWQTAGQQPVLVNCGPGMQTLVRPVSINGHQVSQVECVTANGAVYAGRPVQAAAYESPLYDARMSRPSPVYQQSAPRRVVSRTPQRSWAKTALVIGGTTATGAGVGGLIGGRKGALIGAAIGGGAGTIYEVQKRR